MSNGLQAVEDLLVATPSRGNFSCGDFPTIADICIVAQCFASRRLQVPVDSFARVAHIDAQCRDLPAFRAAAPENQPDFEA
jgi:glutathione S-transferase